MYVYEIEKPKIFTEEGQNMFLHIRDQVKEKIKLSGAVTMDSAISGIGGDSWRQMACVDRLVELGEIKEIPQQDCMGQHRVFVPKR